MVINLLKPCHAHINFFMQRLMSHNLTKQ